MRIAQVVPRGEQPWSGVLTVILHLAAALARRGHRVDVWPLHEWPPDAHMGRDEHAERGRADLLLSHHDDGDSVAERCEAVCERAGETRPRVTT
jgi:hypothetical protein